MWSCACQSPATVDLTEAFLPASTKVLFEAQPALVESLSTQGWCIVSIDLTRLDDNSPIKSIQPLEMKRRVQDLFSHAFVAAHQHVKKATFRGQTAESGLAGSTKSEPKRSWEVKRCCSSAENDSSEPLPMAQEWTRALHSVAVAVTRVLDMPPNTLCTTSDESCTIDLLRIFFYDAVNDSEEETLGSSPHTDWGSWTVVWQDDVGGLQTYCHVHSKWVDVPAPSLEKNCVYFVVHVGDVTSLALGHAMATTRKQKEQGGKCDDKAPTVVWPSPRHRVKSPAGSTPRASLVYFAYPPPGLSLQDMEEALVDYDKSNSSPVVVPYDEYFVLKNQSTNGSTRLSPKDTYERIRSRPLDGVFAEKWQQVQR